MIYGSVCSGIEAASCAWHPLGWSPSFFSEIDAFPRAVLAHRFPEVPLHGDFTTIQAGDYRPIDLLVGGPPCQSFSIAGLRGGLDDDRGNLALEYLRLADRLRPRWLVWENVPGVLSSNGGRDFGSILGGMVQLGYGFAYRVLDAQFFGVAQRRRRVFVVGHSGGWRAPAATIFERASLAEVSPPSRHPRSAWAFDNGLSRGFNMPVGEDFSPCMIKTRGYCVAAAGLVRSLSPTECERLQGFPDGWTAIPYRGKPASDGPRYKALGNSMAVPVMAWIGRRIAAVENLHLNQRAA
ncbi:MAG: DNA cytosine methyltransferase [Pseudomonadota bacterium]